MTEERKGEIALMLLRATLKEKGMYISPKEVAEKINGASNITGISVDELTEFTKPLLQELFIECFAGKVENETTSRAYPHT